MEQHIIKKTLKVEGMTCSGCENRIEKKLKALSGVNEVIASFNKSMVTVTYDVNVIKIAAIIIAIEKLDYKVRLGQPGSGTKAVSKSPISYNKTNKPADDKKTSINQILGIGIVIFALYLLISKTVGFNFIPQVNQNMGFGILFVVGLFTSIHCIAMCGGINLSQCVAYKFDETEQSKIKKLKPSLLYNAGRVASYTIIGGIVGALGSAISFSGTAKGIIAVLSGTFMVIMGLNMLNIFPWLKRFNPRMPKFLSRFALQNKGNSPFYVGLLNGLMPCGPLQAMQIYALGTGSFINGALSMFMFSLGTVPLMFGFGTISSFLSGKFTKKMMKASAILVMILGIVMVGRGLNLSGINTTFAATGTTKNVAKVEGDFQVITTKFESGNYVPIVVKKGIPVKWIINVTKEDLNGCNNPVTIPKYNIKKTLVPGDNEINFTPVQEGTIPYTCWMGMVSSTITVTADGNKVSAETTSIGDITNPQDNNAITAGAGAGGCCAAGAKATKFAGGKIPTDEIQIAKVVNGVQEVTVTVKDEGYSPAALVVQKGLKTKVKFIAEKLNSCNNVVVFPGTGEQLDLKTKKESAEFTADKDITFQCWMGMLHGYIKVVDDIKNIDLESIKTEIQQYTPASSGGCCG